MTAPEVTEDQRAASTADAASEVWLTLDRVLADGDWSAFGPIETTVDEAVIALCGHPRLRKLPAAAACIALSSDAAVRQLNRSYRGLDKATNVLSFDAPSSAAQSPGSPKYLGDIVLAAETILREAADLGISPEHHLQHLVVHAVLHLLAYDHETEERAATMERLETEILASMGIADPYRGEAA